MSTLLNGLMKPNNSKKNMFFRHSHSKQMELRDRSAARYRWFADCKVSQRYLDDSKCNSHRKCNYNNESAKVQNIADQVLRHDASGELKS